jgi:hypothetical protein
VRSHRYFEKQQRPQPEIRQQSLRRHVESTLVASAYFEQKHRSQHFLTYVTYYQTELSHIFERQGRTVEHLSQLLVETASRGDPSIYPLGLFFGGSKGHSCQPLQLCRRLWCISHTGRSKQKMVAEVRLWVVLHGLGKICWKAS